MTFILIIIDGHFGGGQFEIFPPQIFERENPPPDNVNYEMFFLVFPRRALMLCVYAICCT